MTLTPITVLPLGGRDRPSPKLARLSSERLVHVVCLKDMPERSALESAALHHLPPGLINTSPGTRSTPGRPRVAAGVGCLGTKTQISGSTAIRESSLHLLRLFHVHGWPNPGTNRPAS